ncbi:hypothetical protein LIER_26384 [Lithospermum erythrorhizon]|uniref:Uncharacterized protein n=1 Tax=Lithospermum erythrorhizon TaxID=34254 RepID=A0AAV3R8F0_LITER
MRCDHYGKRVHFKSGYFKIIGYPEKWSRPRKNIGMHRGKYVAHNAFFQNDNNGDTSLDSKVSSGGNNVELQGLIASMIQQEMGKAGKEFTRTTVSQGSNLTGPRDYSGSTIARSSNTVVMFNDEKLMDN